MADALLLLDLEPGNRPLSRLLLAADGRAATVHGLVTLPGDRALLWAGIPHGRTDHVVAVMRRGIGVRDVAVVEQADPWIRVVRHRVHVADTVDVTIDLAVAGTRHVGAGDGPTLYHATRRAVASCFDIGTSAEEGWLTTHPQSGEPMAIVRTDRGVHCCSRPTPESAALAAVLAGVPRARSERPVARVLHQHTG